jgi:outer membrane protein assembly factor BamB
MRLRNTKWIAGGLLVTVLLTASDWPQWRGPQRNGVSHETGLLKEWSKDGPRLLWKAADIGNGYSTPSVAAGRIYLLSNRGNDEFAVILDEKSGKQLRSIPIGKVGKNFGPQYPGSRSTPTVDGENIYCLSSGGDLVCLDCKSGEERWRKNFRKDFGGRAGSWAYSESPLVDGDVLVCTPGGKEATLVALNKKTGEVIWKSAVPGGDDAAYASIIIAPTPAGKEYVQFLQKGVVGVDAATGKFLWRYTKSSERSPANIPTPVFNDGYIFTSTGMTGAGLTQLTADKDKVSAKEVYFSKQLKNPLGGVVLVGKHLYGTTGEALFCADFATGEIMWQNPSVGKGALCSADGNLYVRGEKGDVALVEATPEGYREKGRFSQPERSDKPAWPYPIIANGRLYLRDQERLFSYDVKGP